MADSLELAKALLTQPVIFLIERLLPSIEMIYITDQTTYNKDCPVTLRVNFVYPRNIREA